MSTIIVKLENLYLDPNNYRLRSHPKYRFIDKKSELKPAIQTRTNNLLTGDYNSEVNELIESIISNGFLRVDNILVRPHSLKNSEYIVVEGNRRIAVLKYLYEQFKKGYDIGKLDAELFNKGVEVISYEFDNELDYLILMGLKHVSGNKKWDTYNQAKLIYELSIQGYSNSEIAKKIGLYKSEVERQIRGYHAIEEFIKEVKDENLGGKFDPHDKFMIFIELTNKPNLKKWIGWDEKNYRFKNKKNKERFFSWIKPEIGNDEETNTPILLDPIIVSHKQVRQLDEIINDEETLEFMERTKDFELSLSQNENYSQKKFSKTLLEIEKTLKSIPYGATLSTTSADKKTLKNIEQIINNFLGGDK